MGLWSATSIGVGAMIGAGIFALIGIAVQIAGQLAYVSFIIAGIIAAFTSYSVSKLAVKFPSKGGRVEYLNRAFGKGIFAGGLNITIWLGYTIVTALYAKAFSEYAAALLGMQGHSLFLSLMSIAIVALFIFINFAGSALVGKSELVTVIAKIGILLLFCILGFTTVQSSELSVSKSFDFADVMFASGVIFMSYEGFGLVANTAEDVRKPSKNLPKALFLSICIVMLVYILTSVVVIGNLSIPEILKAKEYVLAEAARPLLGEIGFDIMAIAALFSTASAINATIYGPVNMVHETAKANQLPSFLVKKIFNHKSGIALLVTGGLVILITITLDLEAIAEVGSLVFLMIYTLVNIANFKLRRKTKSKAWLVVLGIAGTSFAFAALFYHELQKQSLSLYVFFGLVLLCFIYEWIFQRKNLKNQD
ncbi:amino acid:proton symporter, ABT family [Psychroflexus sediminis]|uniref:Amino acid:proton symporter, ABT family n=2 Tax=Psychroflexus sediminis TaxID=470826 RepID=A0A1G7W8N7_9FLAO|nr:amino acid:proton symporter, ABT family [Psychroflexus sediminis]